MRGSVRFCWGPKTARIQIQSDLLTPLLRLLGDLKEVSRVVKHATMTPECRLPSNANA
ncbi:hypothetical protein PHMEG_00011268 [Phytophthora megakarya]|uniref:Uncharacterized protein n=1 Tax=Phytophthora megakarya TaxID=4795 RepID=A0A225WC63_9STRA|nr:hypothetical protein PHMEG_00011268 [Phytophthora megakarya]